MISSHAKSTSNICRFANKLHKHVQLNALNFGISVHSDRLLKTQYSVVKNKRGKIKKTPVGLEPKTRHRKCLKICSIQNNSLESLNFCDFFTI